MNIKITPAQQATGKALNNSLSNQSYSLNVQIAQQCIILTRCDALCQMIKRSASPALISKSHLPTGQACSMPGKLLQDFMNVAHDVQNMGIHQLRYNYQFNPAVSLFLDYANHYHQTCSTPVFYMSPLEAYARIFNDLRIAANDRKFLASVQQYRETINQNQKAVQQRLKHYLKASLSLWMIPLQASYQHMLPEQVAVFNLISRLEHHRATFVEQLQQLFPDHFMGLEWSLEYPLDGSLRYQMMLILAAPDITQPVHQGIIAQCWHDVTIEGYPVRRSDSQLVACYQERPLLVRAGDIDAIKEIKTRLAALQQAHYLGAPDPAIFGESTGFFQTPALLEQSKKASAKRG